MNKTYSIETIDKTNLSEQTKFRLDEISKIENYFVEEINQRKWCSKKLSKYVAAFYYIDKILIVLSAATGGISIYSFTSLVGAPVGIASEKKKKKKHDKTLMLAKSKFNSIEFCNLTLILQAIIDLDISHEEFITILEDKDKYEKMKDNLRSENEKLYEIMRLSSVKPKT